jgi:hypothetical protein
LLVKDLTGGAGGVNVTYVSDRDAGGASVDHLDTTDRVPGWTKVGAATIGFGLIFDLSEHSFATATSGTFTVGEHAAHLVVLVGMVLALAGIVVDGLRNRDRSIRPERSSSDALR